MAWSIGLVAAGVAAYLQLVCTHPRNRQERMRAGRVGGAPQLPSFASSVIGVADSALETGQPTLASFACSRNVA